MGIDDIVAEVDRYDDAFVARLAAAENRLIGSLSAAVSSKDLDRARDITSARAEVQRYMTDAGYYDVMLDDSRYQYYVEQSAALFAAQNATGIVYSEATLQELQILKDAKFAQALSLADDIQEQLTQGIIDLRFGGVTSEELIEQLLSRGFTRARTLVSTANSGFFNAAHTRLAEDIGVTQFVYLGPRDKLTRPFCRKHIDEVKTQAEWEALDNGQGLPVFVFAGGYNCRHRLVGKIDEQD